MNANSVLHHVGILEVDGNVTLLVGEGGLGIGLEDIAGKENAFASRGAKGSFHFDIGDERLLVVFQLGYGCDFELDTGGHKVLDAGTNLTIEAGGVSFEVA